MVSVKMIALSKEGSAPAGKPDVRYGVRDVSSGHGRDTNPMNRGSTPMHPNAFGESGLAGREPGNRLFEGRDFAFLRFLCQPN